MVIASRLANLAPPVDGVTADFNDGDQLQQAVARARRMGFGAKLCIHPSQVEAVNQGLLPGHDEIAWARAVMAAVEASGGAAVALQGRMIDQPVILQARRVLEQLA